MYTPDNNDAYTSYDMERGRYERLHRRSEAEESADNELPWVVVPNDYGTHLDLYKEEVSVNIIKVKFLKDGQPSGRAYTYFSENPVEVGNMVQINSQSIGVVTDIDVPEEEIADYKDKVKHIYGLYQEPIETEEEVE